MGRAQRGQGARVQRLIDTLLGGTDPTDRYNFAAVGKWCDRVPGGMNNLDDIFIPVNPNGNH